MKCIFTASVKTASMKKDSMKKWINIISITALTITGALAINSQPQAQEQKKIKIVTTIGEITDATRIIGGDHVLVSALMGPGVDPHLYKASASDVTKLAEADMILYNGLNLEANMAAMFERLKRSKTTVALAEADPVELRLESLDAKGYYDPHVCFDVELWQHVVERIAQTLGEYDPEHEEEYKERAGAYWASLTELHEYVATRAQELPETQRVLVSAHNAFRYFGRKYGFETIGLQSDNTQMPMGTNDVTRLADFIIKRKIRAIFVESSLPDGSIKAVQDAARQRGWDVAIVWTLYADAIGSDGTFEGTYIGAGTHNIDTIVNALKTSSTQPMINK